MPSKSLFRLLFVFAMSAWPCGSAVAVSASQAEALYQQMLKDPEFKAADKELAAVYARVRKGLDADGQTRLRDEQRLWVKGKDEAVGAAEPGKRTQLAVRLTLERIRTLQAPAEPAPGQGLDEKKVNALLATLKSTDADTRLEALRELEYSLDPRLPEVLFGLLNDSGNTIRRVAAHGIGSRWWQIPKSRVNAFLDKLRATAKSKEDGDYAEWECRRSINILLQSQGKNIEFPETVALSPNGRWLIYDRLGYPCLIDVKNQTEELLGWGKDGRDGRFQSHVKWHPTKEIALIDFANRRGTAAITIWTPGKPVKSISKNAFVDLLQKRKIQTDYIAMDIDLDQVQWQGGKVAIPVSFDQVKGGSDFVSRSAVFSLDLSSAALTLDKVK